MIQKSKSGEAWDYTYDTSNRMVKAEKRNGVGGTLQGSVEYAFDVFGNRLSRVEKNGSGTVTAT